jgi:hypothetical protein
MSVFYEKQGFVTAERDTELSSVIVHWEDLNDGDVVKECTLAQLEEVKNGAKTIVVDTKKAKGSPPSETQHWFQDVLFPQLAEAGLKAVITVKSEKLSTRAASVRWELAGSMFDFEMYDADELNAALELARTFAGK